MLIFNRITLLVSFLFFLSTVFASENQNVPDIPWCFSLWTGAHHDLLKALFINDMQAIKRIPVDTPSNIIVTTLLIELAGGQANIMDQTDRLALINRLVNYGADINAQSNAGDTALVKALENDAWIALELASLGANPYIENDQKKTAYSLLQELTHTDGLGSSVMTCLNKLEQLFQKHKLL